jgi:hypothetical protein
MGYMNFRGGERVKDGRGMNCRMPVEVKIYTITYDE